MRWLDNTSRQSKSNKKSHSLGDCPVDGIFFVYVFYILNANINFRAGVIWRNKHKCQSFFLFLQNINYNFGVYPKVIAENNNFRVGIRLFVITILTNAP